jgi:hypothetical protein
MFLLILLVTSAANANEFVRRWQDRKSILAGGECGPAAATSKS